MTKTATKPTTEPAAIEAEAVSVNQLTRLDQAQNLPELDADESAEPVCAFLSAIESFKDNNHRTMRIVVLDGELYKQAI